ncbi:MAG: hypothetical protein JXB05_08950 [Myxococcaceae bacterium]|nr:hypothetical protein [Myxococcaceae bacterium]
MMRAACALLSLLLWACEPASLPPPTIVSVEPEVIPSGSPSVIAVRVDAVRPFSLDYQERSVDPQQLAMTLRIAGHVVNIAFAESDGTLVAPVPEGLSLGEHEIRVTLADGREAVRESAFSVVPPSTLIGGGPGEDGGSSPDGGAGRDELWFFLAGPVEDQVVNVPFKVNIYAVGPGSKAFQRPVTLRASRGTVTTIDSGSFTQGLRVDEISLDQEGPDIYLLVEDARGTRGLSNAFTVRAR